MRNQDHDGTNNKTLDSSGNKRFALWNTGATAPTKITTKHGYSFDGGDYMQISDSGISNVSQFSCAVEFEPFYAYNEGGDQFIVGSAPLSYISIRIVGSNLYLYFPGGGSVGIVTATFSPYWQQKSRNVIVVSCKSGNNKLWLNGYDMLSNTSAWSPEALTIIYLGLYPSSYLTGNITRFACWNTYLNSMQVKDLTINWQMKASEM